MILKMLEDGKITAEQAVELLAAVGTGRASEPPITEPTIDLVQRQGKDRRIIREEERRIRQQVKEESRRARSAVRDAMRELRNSLPRGLEQSILHSLTGMSTGIGGKEYSFKRDHSGEFATDVASVHIQNTNGHIDLLKSPDQSWHLSLSMRVRAENEDVAKSVAEKLAVLTCSEKGLLIAAQKLFGQNAAVNITLSLPDLPVRLNATSTNGTISVTDISGQDFVLKTVNGKVIINSVRASQIEAGAINGSIVVSAATRTLRCKGANGRIQAELQTIGDAEVDLNTVNGTIHLTLPDDEQIGYAVSADTTAGSIKVDIPGVEIQQDKHKPGRRSLRVQSLGMEKKRYRQSIRARSVSGKITIHTEGDEI